MGYKAYTKNEILATLQSIDETMRGFNKNTKEKVIQLIRSELRDLHNEQVRPLVEGNISIHLTACSNHLLNYIDSRSEKYINFALRELSNYTTKLKKLI